MAVPVGCLHTHTCTPGNPDTYRHTPAPSYRRTPLCRRVVTLICRLPVFLSVLLYWGQAAGTKCLGLLWRTEAYAKLEQGPPSQLVSSARWKPRIPCLAGSCLSGAPKARLWEGCVRAQHSEFKCDSGARNDNKSDVLPHEEMEIMKMGAVGETWQRAFSALPPARVLGGARATAALQGALVCPRQKN